MTARARSATQDDVVIACSLQGADVRSRIDDWQGVLAHVARREPLIGGQRLVFTPDVPVGDLMALVAAEQECCRFFGFNLTIDRSGVVLEVTAPAEADPLVEAVFGP